MWIQVSARDVNVGALGVLVGVEQGAAMFGAPATLGRSSPLARRPLTGLRWLRATPFGRGTTGGWVRLRGDALRSTCGAEVELARLAAIGPRA